MQTETQAALDAADNMSIALTFVHGLVDKAAAYLPNVVGALAVLVIGLWAAGRIKKIVSHAMSRTGRIDETLAGFLSSLVHYGLIVLVVITTLGIFGVPTTSFAAVIGAAGLAIGLALQGTLGHVASGVMMLGFRPFDVGDYVEAAGVAGTVKHIGLFTTEIATPDNKKIIVPNGKIFDGEITNYSGFETRRIDIMFGISYADDIEKAIGVIKSVVDAESLVLKDPAPVYEVDSLGDSSVNLLCRVWMNRADYFAVKWALTKNVKLRFDAEGVTIPFPCRSVFMEKAA